MIRRRSDLLDSSFVPSGSLHYMQLVTDDFRLGITTGSYFGLGVDSGYDWARRMEGTIERAFEVLAGTKYLDFQSK